jgi:NitT/TauT family transport system substrate-binding protein
VQLLLWESFRAAFYTPFYVALAPMDGAPNCFDGLDIEFGAVPPGVEIGASLREGRPDVVWGGPMRVIRDFDQRPADRPRSEDLVCFCEVVARDPFYLVGPEARDFALADLKQMSLSAVSEVPTPWLCLQEDLRRAGIDPDTVNRVSAMTMPEAVAALENRKVDVIQIFEPLVEQLVGSGKGFVWNAAADRGLTSYTSLYATRRWLSSNQDRAAGLVRGIYRAQQWVHANDAETIADRVAPFFSDLSHSLLAGAISRYLDKKIWGPTPIMSEAGFDRQAAGLASGGFVSAPPAYDDCVDMTIAKSVVKSAAGSDTG